MRSNSKLIPHAWQITTIFVCIIKEGFAFGRLPFVVGHKEGKTNQGYPLNPARTIRRQPCTLIRYPRRGAKSSQKRKTAGFPNANQRLAMRFRSRERKTAGFPNAKLVSLYANRRLAMRCVFFSRLFFCCLAVSSPHCRVPNLLAFRTFYNFPT